MTAAVVLAAGCVAPAMPGASASSGGPLPISVGGTYRPLTGDFNGDGADDILWYGPGTAPDALWYGQPDAPAEVPAWGRRPISVGGTYRTTVGDFDNDGRDDIVWYGFGSNPDNLWMGTATKGSFERHAFSLGGNRQPIAVRDSINGDYLMLYGPGTATDLLTYFTFDGAGRPTLSPPEPARVDGVYLPFTGDFDGNDFGDVFWYAPGSGPDRVDFLEPNGLVRRGVSIGAVAVSVAGDFDGDSRDDVLWYGPGTAPERLDLGRADKTFVRAGSSATPVASGKYTAVIPGDFDGDGTDEMLWYRAGVGADWYAPDLTSVPTS